VVTGALDRPAGRRVRRFCRIIAGQSKFITDTIYLSSARERKRNLGVAAAAQGGVGARVHAAASAADAVGCAGYQDERV
jgi:hypothetical protein